MYVSFGTLKYYVNWESIVFLTMILEQVDIYM